MYKISSDNINKSKKTWQSNLFLFEKAMIDYAPSTSNICKPKRKNESFNCFSCFFIEELQ